MTSNVLWNVLSDVPWSELHTSDPPNPATSLTVASDATQRWEVGDFGEWFDDGTNDIFQVTAVAATTLTISAGQLGSTAADHAANARIRKLTGTRFRGAQVAQALNDAIAGDLWPNIYAVYVTDTAAAPTTTRYYSISANAYEVRAVYQKSDSSTPQDILWFPGSEYSQPVWVDSTISSTNKAVRIDSLRDVNNTLFIFWTRPPAVGDLSDGQKRIVEYGAAKRLLTWEAAKKAGSEPAAEDPRVRGARWYDLEQAALLKAEKSLLDKMFPRRRTYIGPDHYIAAAQAAGATFH